MPELPEVETIRAQLSSYMPARIISVSCSEFSSSIIKEKNFSPKNKTIQAMKRYGKALIFNLSGEKFILSHLGMSGAWIVSDKRVKEKHTHVQFKCENKKQTFYLAYIDPRRFGNMYFFNKDQKLAKIKAMGIDVSSKKMDADHVYAILQKHPQREIKPLLLEQKYFAGIGNYMASEILGLSKILPDRLCGNVSKKEANKICESTRKVIDKSTKAQGLTFHGGYRDASGNKGEALSTLVVFNQKICQMCKKTEVIKSYQGGRGTYYCPKCQK